MKVETNEDVLGSGVKVTRGHRGKLTIRTREDTITVYMSAQQLRRMAFEAMSAAVKLEDMKAKRIDASQPDPFVDEPAVVA